MRNYEREVGRFYERIEARASKKVRAKVKKTIFEYEVTGRKRETIRRQWGLIWKNRELLDRWLLEFIRLLIDYGPTLKKVMESPEVPEIQKQKMKKIDEQFVLKQASSHAAFDRFRDQFMIPIAMKERHLPETFAQDTFLRITQGYEEIVNHSFRAHISLLQAVDQVNRLI